MRSKLRNVKTKDGDTEICDLPLVVSRWDWSMKLETLLDIWKTIVMALLPRTTISSLLYTISWCASDQSMRLTQAFWSLVLSRVAQLDRAIAPAALRPEPLLRIRSIAQSQIHSCLL